MTGLLADGSSEVVTVLVALIAACGPIVLAYLVWRLQQVHRIVNSQRTDMLAHIATLTDEVAGLHRADEKRETDDRIARLETSIPVEGAP